MRDLSARVSRLFTGSSRPQKASTDRSELFAASSSTSTSVSQPYATSRHTSSSSYSRHHPDSSLSAPPPSDVSIQIGTPSPLAGRNSSGFQPNSPYPNSPYDARTNHALREHDFLGQTGAALDGYLAQGQAVLGNLASQRDVLKGASRG